MEAFLFLKKEKLMEIIENFIDALYEISGDKIVTIAVGKDEAFKFDVFKNGKVGYEPEHKMLFKMTLIRALTEGGGVVIRAFSQMTYQKINPEGKKIRLPYKRVYGAFFGNNKINALNSSEVEKAFGSKEEGVVYKELVL
jgi:hypothetical protein